MITNNNISLPYPTLGLEGDFKEGGFTVKPLIQSIDDELHIVEDDVEITNKYINQLYENKEITTVYKIICSSTLYSETFFNRKNMVIPMELLANYIVIEVFLIANCDILDYCDDSFNNDYKLGKSKGKFEIKKGNIMGFAGSSNIPLKKSYAKGIGSMFKWKIREDAPVSFDVESGDHIVIYYPHEKNQLNIVNVIPKKKKMTFLNLFIVPALNKAFNELVKQNENGNIQAFKDGHEWAMIITETFINWDNIDTYCSAQNYLQQIIGEDSKTPILEAFEELK